MHAFQTEARLLRLVPQGDIVCQRMDIWVILRDIAKLFSTGLIKSDNLVVEKASERVPTASPTLFSSFILFANQIVKDTFQWFCFMCLLHV